MKCNERQVKMEGCGQTNPSNPSLADLMGDWIQIQQTFRIVGQQHYTITQKLKARFAGVENIGKLFRYDDDLFEVTAQDGTFIRRKTEPVIVVK